MLRTIDDKVDNEQNTTEKNEKIKRQGFAKSFASNITTDNNSKKSISYRSYTDKQIIDFISLIIKMVPIKDAASRTGIILYTEYHIRKMWNGNQEVTEKKRNCTKKDVLKVKRTFFIV